MQHEYHIHIALTVKGMGGAREHPLQSIQIVAGAEVVPGNQSDAARFWSNANVTGDVPFSHHMRPLTAASMQASVVASTGR